MSGDQSLPPDWATALTTDALFQSVQAAAVQSHQVCLQLSTRYSLLLAETEEGRDAGLGGTITEERRDLQQKQAETYMRYFQDTVGGLTIVDEGLRVLHAGHARIVLLGRPDTHETAESLRFEGLLAKLKHLADQTYALAHQLTALMTQVRTVGAATADAAALPRIIVDKAVLESGITTCAICLNDLQVLDEVTKLPCNHMEWHSGCIGSWLAGHNSCPHCRRPVSDSV